MNTAEQINLVVNNLTEKLGVAAENLYPVLIKQAFINGIQNTIGLIVLILLISTSIYGVYRWFKQKNRDKDTDPIIVIAGFIIVITLITITTVVASETITCFMNPEYRALEMILQQLKYCR